MQTVNTIRELHDIREFKQSLGIREVLHCLDVNNYAFCVMPSGDLNTIRIHQLPESIWGECGYGTPEPSSMIKPPFRIFIDIHELREALK